MTSHNEEKPLQEGKVTIIPYGSLREANLDQWGGALWRTEESTRPINIYTDQAFIREYFVRIFEATIGRAQSAVVADLGGSDGIISRALSEQRVSNQTILNFDINYEALARGRQPGVERIQADILRPPLRQYALDFAVARFALPYLGIGGQQQFYETLFPLLRTGGKVVIMHDGTLAEEEDRQYNRFFAAVNKVIGNSRKENHYASVEEVVRDAVTAGFRVQEARLLEEVEAQLSPASYASRFKMNPEQSQRLEALFNIERVRGVLPFTAESNPHVKRPLVYVILEKRAI